MAVLTKQRLSVVDTAAVQNAALLWQEIVEDASDSWLWHTYLSFSFNLFAGQEFGAEDRSFFIYDGERAVGVVPLIIQTRDGGGGFFREAAFYSGFLPWPCFRAEEASRIPALDKFAFEGLERRARISGATRIRIRLTPSTNRGDEQERVERIVHEFGYTPQRLDIHAISINPDTLKNVRERYRRYYKKFSPLFNIQILEGTAVTEDFVNLYAQLHERDAGRRVRSSESYQKQADNARFGEGFYVAATHKESQQVAGVLLISLYKNVANDGSVAIDPLYADLYVGHILRWAAIEELSRCGIPTYELGARADADASEKERGISHFKEGWSRGKGRVLYQLEKSLT